jgi:subtilase family serine protease
VLVSGGHLVRPPVHRIRIVVRRSLAGRAVPAGTAPPAVGTPQFLQQAYDLTSLAATRGVGDTVAVVDAYSDPAIESDLNAFRSTYGLGSCTVAGGCLRIVNQNGAAAPLPAADAGWATEETLDVEAVSALCPNCHILLVETNSTNWSDLVAGDEAAASLGARQISDSWGSTVPAGTNVGWPANLSGGSGSPEVVAASGDSGAVPAGQVSVPAALPAVTAAGGTSLTSDAGATPAPRGFSESAWSGAGSGCDSGAAVPSWQPAGLCLGRAFSDVSADADPNTGLDIYQAAIGGWAVGGGTSLASPLIAAYEAITGIDARTPQWAYGLASLLNPAVGGSNGACTGLVVVLCNALGGYSGPTGTGSISGQVVSGAPGIGGASISNGRGGSTYTVTSGATTATVSGGVYANGLPTSYAWQYGTSTAYGSQSPTAVLATGTGPVLATAQLTGLAPGTTYHYRLVATNADGTSYGYDYTVTTAPGSGSGSLSPSGTATGSGSGATATATVGATGPVATHATGGVWAPASTAPRRHAAGRRRHRRLAHPRARRVRPHQQAARPRRPAAGSARMAG